MAWDQEHGCTTPGSIGRGTHLGEPLTVAQIQELPDGAEIVVTWDGGNGPWPYRVLVDASGQRLAEGLYCDPLLVFGSMQTSPLHRITVGWDDTTRAWFESMPPLPEHIQAKIRALRDGDRTEE